jgi:RHS repeat-associated protein
MFSSTAIAPFGEAYAQAGTTDLNFTGQNQDTVGGVYDFPSRELGAVSGRWPSPDPAGLAAVNPANPQSWNRYAYVQNDPLRLTDPRGLDCIYYNGDGTAEVYYGDCASDNDSGVYVNCDGCVYNSSSDTITQDENGNETLTDSEGDTFDIGQAGIDPGVYQPSWYYDELAAEQATQQMWVSDLPSTPQSILDQMMLNGSINILTNTANALEDPWFYAEWETAPLATAGCLAMTPEACFAAGLGGAILYEYVVDPLEQYEIGPPVHVPDTTPPGEGGNPEPPAATGSAPPPAGPPPAVGP